MMASQETTAVLVANTILLLSRHKNHWDNLRKIVIERGEALFTFDNLSNVELLQNIIAECK
jgi:cytochrome P450